MKSVSILQISQTKTREVPAIINDWKNYETNSVILAFCETKRRKIPLTEEVQQSFQDFLASNKATEDELLNQFLQENEAISYDDLFKKETTPVVTEESVILKKIKNQQYQKAYEAEKMGGGNDILWGAVIFGIGCIVTIATLQNGSGYVTYGAIIFGFIKMVKGFIKVS